MCICEFCFGTLNTVQMPWYVHRVLRLTQKNRHVLPYGRFLLVNESKQNREAYGWLPCHHGNVEYTLGFKHNGDIASIEWMSMCRKKNRAPVSAAARLIEQGKLGPVDFNKEEYLQQAEHAYKDQAIWSVAVLYTYKRVMQMDVKNVFSCLTSDPEAICMRGSAACQPRLMYDEQRAMHMINKFLKTISEAPYEDMVGFRDRIQWQKRTRYATAALEAPSDNIRGLQRYQDMWTTLDEIALAHKVKAAITPDNCTVWLGTPCHAALKGKKVVVSSLEEAFALKCFVSVDIYMIDPPFDEEYRAGMGLPHIQTLGNGEDVCVPWSHLWSIEKWIQLIDTQPQSYVCVGRLDQYSNGRGDVFRQMAESDCPTHIGHHFKTNRVEMVSTDDVAAFVQSLDAPTIQCFSEKREHRDIDTGRRWLKYPARIRTLATRKSIRLPRIALCEEHFTLEYRVGENASVVPVRKLLTPVDVGVYICSEDTVPFDVHVARSLCRHKLYVVNCTRSLFAWKHESPRTIAVNPFI